MTEYQLADLILNTQEIAFDVILSGGAVFGAFLVMTYSVGEKLTSGQAIFASVLFTIFALLTTLVASVYLYRAYQLIEIVRQMEPVAVYYLSPAVPLGVIFLSFLGIIGNLKLMYDVRQPRV